MNIPTQCNTTSFTITMRCAYSGQCKSEGLKCVSCGNNPANQKQDYYVPNFPYICPWQPSYPYPYVICTSDSAQNHYTQINST
ncbi:MAG: hypothetical protein WC365_07610 [Candidatus Babeliales bacterium]